MPSPGKSRAAIYNRQQGLCWYCLRSCRFVTPEPGKLVLPDTFTLDHVVPKSKGGNDWRRNVVGACAECNRAKGARLFNPAMLRRISKLGATTLPERMAWRPWCEPHPKPVVDAAAANRPVFMPLPRAGSSAQQQSPPFSTQIKRVDQVPGATLVRDGEAAALLLAEENRSRVSASQVKGSVVHHAGTTSGLLPSSPGLASRLWQRSLSFLRTLHTRLKRS